MDVATLLEKAADVLDRDGWCRRYMHGLNGGHCARGAMAVVLGFDASVFYNKYSAVALMQGVAPAEDALLRHLGLERGSPVINRVPLWNDNTVPWWNDWVAKDHGEVTSAMRACAAVLRAQQATPAVQATPETVEA